MPIKRRVVEFLPTITVIIIVAVWWLFSIGVNAEIILPSPKVVVGELCALFGEKSFYARVFYSLLRVFCSFLIALTLGAVLAVLSALSKVFERLFYPIIVVVRATPTMSFIFLCIIWFNAEISPLIVSIAVIFPILYSSVLSGIKECDGDLEEMSKVYKVPVWRKVTVLYLPAIARRVYADSISALCLNVKLIIAAEALAQTANSIGSSMNLAKQSLEIAELFAYTIVAIVLSFLLELLLKLIRTVLRRVTYARAKKYC